ncbi:M14 family zinc carboxypeptidase [Streptomyces mayonensis]|uniref:M14 family zinc carboxypeptidase n=1 Tax=Streptomyces mayonensis TaxID=2750816 RepID=UPI001C1E0AA2|nr:M14 family zinc carboxypeptidase [Streptomyces sp. A108]MBU6531872.1 peptidase M14 [Streptomyces sp. A108]
MTAATSESAASATPFAPGPDAWVRHAATVPPAQAYPGVDELVARFRELADRYPALVTERRVGTSALGEPLYCFTVAEDRPTAEEGGGYVVVGGVHPNEPVGAVTTLHLATALCEDSDLRAHFGGAWHIVPCIDPDGARLNEGWFAVPADKRAYGRHFYRPAGDQQVEWTFPFSYKDAYFDRVLPETLALMRLLDATRPRFLTTLHNCETGGVYYYLNRPAPDLYPLLADIPASLGMPLATGEPEAAHAPRHAPAVYGCIDMKDAYDYLEGLGADAAGKIAGSSSAAYAEKYGTFYFVTEVPHWSHPDADDDSPAEQRYADVVAHRARALDETGTFLGGILDRASPHLTIATPFLRAVRDFVPSLTEVAALESARVDDLPDRAATVAERHDCEASVHSFRIRVGGMLLRALGAELAAGTATPEVRRCHRELLATYEIWEREADRVTGEPIAISTLAGIQYGALLAAADHARAADTTAARPERTGEPR